MKIAEALELDCIELNLDVKTREEAIEKLIDSLSKTDSFDEKETIFHAVLERERIMTTGVGNGIAIPHCKHEDCRNFKMALGILSKPVDFTAIDSKPVNIIFLLVGPNNTAGSHIKLLSRISRIVNKSETREELLKFSSSEDVYNFLLEKEKNI
jgi:fructose-specific phosphotransferase system IIA component